MRPLDSPVYHHSTSACYFSYVPSPSTHFSVETPSSSTAAYSYDTQPDPLNPLLAFRELPSNFEPFCSNMGSSKVLQLQTNAAHSRSSAEPVRHRTSVSPSNSDSSTSSASSGRTSPTYQSICCARCRRSSIGFAGVVKIGTNLFYCNHCATMVGYGAD